MYLCQSWQLGEKSGVTNEKVKRVNRCVRCKRSHLCRERVLIRVSACVCVIIGIENCSTDVCQLSTMWKQTTKMCHVLTVYLVFSSLCDSMIKNDD